MKTTNILLLGSTSMSRQKLLKEASIQYKIVEQNADEKACDWSLPLQKLVECIAVYKMEQVILPKFNNNNYCYVLTADTLGIRLSR